MRRDGLKSAILVVEQGRKKRKKKKKKPSFGAPRKQLKFGFIVKFSPKDGSAS